MKERSSIIYIGLLCFACSQAKSIDIPEPLQNHVNVPTMPESIPEQTGKIGTEDSNPQTPDGMGNGTNPTVPNPDLPSVPVVHPEFPAAHQAVAALQSFYDPLTGLWSSAWWGSANGLTAIIDYMDRSGSREYLSVVDTTFEKNKATNFINEYYEDSGWWGLAWLRAYDLTKEQKYLNMAKLTADDMMSNGWDEICGGGIYWKTDHASKRAITNELYIKLAAGLHNRIPGDTKYLANALKTWKWFAASGIINSANLINVSIVKSSCMNSADTTWSHNQGVILGALNELYKATQDVIYLNRAKVLALASSKALSISSNILKERDDPGCGTCKGDERLYKGIYVRNLREINEVLADATLEELLNNNAKLAWEKARGPNDLIGFRWEGPFDSYDAQRQISAVDLFNSRIKNKFSSNLALNKSVAATGSCSPSEGGPLAVDGSAQTKWCMTLPGSGAGAAIDIDLGAEKALKSVRILHAGAGAETLAWNSQNFEILISNAASGPFTELVKVFDNTSSSTYHPISGSARYLRLHISKAGADNTARIYDINIE